MSDYKNILKNIDNINKKVEILFIGADFNKEFVNEYENIVKIFLNENGFKNINKVNVPGALEIPAMLNRILLKKHYDLVFCFGVVIRGETTHYEIVSNNSAEAIMQLTLKFPQTGIINGILTCENITQVKERVNKNIAISGLNLLNEITKIG